MSNKFQVGDVVSAWGHDGVVIEPIAASDIRVQFSNASAEMPFIRGFNFDGRLESWHAEPTLKFVSRPKRRVKKTIEGWINREDAETAEVSGLYFYPKKHEWASMSSHTGSTICATLTYEIEE